MVRKFKTFLQSDAGAVTVDWVVLTASVVAMAAISFFEIRDNADNMDNAAGDRLGQEITVLYPAD
ncbi:hypothetical protein AL036_00240 [Salipiger aestuarii]|uniref:Flp pilus assembly pilin Flp n=2 Tax=Salipiger aestuarii TaxID=568098 RepID=A0A327YN00_9RHOB|nr:hypothetical protein C357_22090 [Citreicella sp. 357]KAA8610350.1 hypothetical protein AL036_00240 [Salipiger aestuarii]KAA8616366.1 hypothetical protein AL037_00245 [Salipiger aestuarii]KAB2543539.1 hypothetical protein AL035_01745 [Salipiger aestuarii]RAK21892.1 hypothetical protein ATI53_100348 [Salipiger aestuarii]